MADEKPGFWDGAGSLLLGGVSKYIDADISSRYAPRDDRVYTEAGNTGKAYPAGDTAGSAGSKDGSDGSGMIAGLPPMAVYAGGGALLLLVVVLLARG